MQPETGWNAELIDAIHQPVWTVRPDGALDYANAFWHAYTGLAETPPLERWCSIAVHADDVVDMQHRWRVATETGEAYESDYRFRRADGLYRWHLARVAPIPGRGDAEARWVASAIDIDDRRRAEEALRASEARYRDVVEHADDIVYTISLDGRVVAMNPAVERMLGYRPEELLGSSIEALIAPDQLDVTRRMRDRKMSGAEHRTYELDAVAKDGRRVALEVNTRLVTAGDRPTVIHGIARDISARRERVRQVELSAAVGAALTARRPLAEQLERCVAAMVDHLDAAFARIWMVDKEDPNVLVLRASAGLYTHLDGPHSRIRVGEFKIGRIAAERRSHLTNRVVDDPEVHDQEWARREGMVSFAGYPLLVGDRLLGVVALFARHALERTTLSTLSSVVDAIAVGIDRDRVEIAQNSLLKRETASRQWAEAAEARYRELFEGVADAILVADVDRQYQDANTAATTLLGYERDELLRLRVEDVVAGGPDWTQAEYIRFSAEGPWQGELELRRKDGSSVPVEARATVVDLPDGSVYLSAVRDISERNHLERLRRDFMAMVTHDLRTPLTAIKGWAQLLRRRTPLDERTQRTIAHMLTQVSRMERLIGDLADIVRNDAGQLQLRREPVDLVELVRQQVMLVQEQADHHMVRVEASDASVVGAWDRQRIGQILQNLLTNALKYSPEGGEITIRIETVEDEAQVSVIDRGVGIHSDHLPLLFKRFYRADATGAGGLGLGLHISEMLVRAHGGRIWATSTPGVGSTFTVALPMSAPNH